MAQKTEITPQEERTRHILELRIKKVPIDEIADSMGIKKETVEKTLTAVKMGCGSYKAYIERHLQNRGYPTKHVYMTHIRDKKSKTLKAKILSSYISASLERLDKKQVWLAERTHLTPMAISLYRRGRSIPGEENFRKVSKAFGDSYCSIDDLVIDYALRIMKLT